MDNVQLRKVVLSIRRSRGAIGRYQGPRGAVTGCTISGGFVSRPGLGHQNLQKSADNNNCRETFI